MRSFSTPLLTVVLLALHVYASPQLATPSALPAKGGPTSPGKPVTGGGNPAESNPSIPNVANATNPTCIPWYGIRDAIMGGLYQGRCGDNARAAIRLAFHDAGTFSLALQSAGLPNGGADGSMLTDPTEVLRNENSGLANIVSLLQPMPAKFGVPPGDIIQIAGVLGVLACPGGPLIRAWVGRNKALNTAPQGLLPDPNSPVPTLLARFADMGFTSRSLMALIGAHSTGKQRFQNTALANESFDTTVDIWDVRFYSQTAAATAQPGTFRLASDVNFAGNASTTTDFNRFVGMQTQWTTEYSAAHEQMSVLGQNVADLTDCTEMLPASISLAPLAEPTTGKPPTDPIIDPVLLEEAIQQFRSIWLVPSS